MKKSRNQIKTISLFAVIALLVGITGFKLVKAYYGDAKVIVEGNYIEASQGGSDLLGGSVHNTMEDFSEGISVDGTAFLNGFGDVTWGANSATLDFSRSNTTTPGALFTIYNGGADKICTVVELDITTGSTVGGRTGAGVPLYFYVATSSAETAFTGTVGTSLIATTTLATGTVAMIDNISNPGAYVGTDQDIGGKPWLWEKGVYLLGTFDSNSDAATSSLSYSSMAGKVYVNCHAR